MRAICRRAAPEGLNCGQTSQPGIVMAKPNYSFEKRQRELAKQKKKAEKDAEKAARKRAGEPAADLDAEPGAPDGETPAEQ
jgi:hypothetical protein